MTKRTIPLQPNISDVTIRYVEFPLTVEGVTIPNPDGTFDIYINDVFCNEKKTEILQHELEHLHLDHFYVELPIGIIESEANRTL
ncbi:MAG: hypothetical protein IJZ15_04280 [Oscillospiraceae bacterium]|nr:hypothetical protein [Oscillospiraceae bacterium]